MMRPLLALLLLLWAAARADEESPSAFRFGTDPRVRRTVDPREVREGTSAKEPRDAIPAIKVPESAPAGEARWVRDGDRVLGLVVNGEARAYPLRVLETHELVDDVLGGIPVAPNY